MSHQILVVSPNDNDLADTLRVLASAGYRASGATTFEEAKELLAIGSPDLVIADERLGAYNGLHVILRARAARPDVSAIVTSTWKDPALESEARRLNVQCLVRPHDPVELLEPISRTFDVAETCARLVRSTVH